GPNGPKQVFLLTATPVNNRLLDLQHMIELFSRKRPDHFKGLGIHSLPGHVRKMEKELLRATTPNGAEATETDLAEVGDVLAGDKSGLQGVDFIEGRQKQIVGLVRTQFLKRFESSGHAFERSCDRLLRKLLAFVMKNAQTPEEKRRLERWQLRNKDLIGYVHD